MGYFDGIKSFTSKTSLPNAFGDVKLEKPTVKQPVSFKFDENKEISRKDLSLVNNFNDLEITLSGAKEIAANTNEIMASLGYPKYKVSPSTVGSTGEAVRTYQTVVAKLELSNGLQDYIPKTVSFDEQLEIAANIGKKPMPEV